MAVWWCLSCYALVFLHWIKGRLKRDCCNLLWCILVAKGVWFRVPEGAMQVVSVTRHTIRYLLWCKTGKRNRRGPLNRRQHSYSIFRSGKVVHCMQLLFSIRLEEWATDRIGSLMLQNGLYLIPCSREYIYIYAIPAQPSPPLTYYSGTVFLASHLRLKYLNTGEKVSIWTIAPAARKANFSKGVALMRISLAHIDLQRGCSEKETSNINNRPSQLYVRCGHIEPNHRKTKKLWKTF